MEFSIIGYSGHAFVVLDSAIKAGHKCIGYCDFSKKENNPYNLIYLGVESDQNTLNILAKTNVALGIGNNKIRERVFNTLAKSQVNFATINHPNAVIANNTTIQNGTVVFAGCIINPLVQIGFGVICNTGSIIEHECSIGNFSHIAPRATLAGNVTIGNNSFIGANSVVKEGIKIGDNVIIGAGSVVVKNIESNSIFFGNPAKFIKYNNE